MKASVIVPVYNALPDLMKLIRSLTVSIDWTQSEVILVDDASKEFNLLELFGAPLKCIRSAENMGFASTCNAGAELATGEILVFLNSDIQVAPNWYKPLIEMFDYANVGVAGPKLLFENHLIQSAGGLYDAMYGPFHRYLGWAQDDWRVNRVEKVSWITGAALAVRKQDFHQVGGFDPAYIRGYFEDVDLCEKIKALGKEVWYQPNCMMLHAAGHSTVVKGQPEIDRANEIFKHNSNLFHERWNSKIKVDVPIVMVNY